MSPLVSWLMAVAAGFAWLALVLTVWLRLLVGTGSRVDVVRVWRGEEIAYAVKFDHPLPRLLAFLAGGGGVVTVARVIFVAGDLLAPHEHARAFAFIVQDCQAMARGEWLTVFTDFHDIVRQLRGPRDWKVRDAMLFAHTYGSHHFSALASPTPTPSDGDAP